MNIYVLVEGEVGEKKVYREWIPCVNGSLTFSPTISEVKRNNFLIFHGGGYPQYFSKIKSAIDDVLNATDDDNNKLFNRLVVSTDAEENSYTEKKQELMKKRCQVTPLNN